jgi:hypothetical protein
MSLYCTGNVKFSVTYAYHVSGEFYILKVRPSLTVQLSVYLMIFGTLVAASNDLAFNLRYESSASIHLSVNLKASSILLVSSSNFAF